MIRSHFHCPIFSLKIEGPMYCLRLQAARQKIYQNQIMAIKEWYFTCIRLWSQIKPYYTLVPPPPMAIAIALLHGMAMVRDLNKYPGINTGVTRDTDLTDSRSMIGCMEKIVCCCSLSVTHTDTICILNEKGTDFHLYDIGCMLCTMHPCRLLIKNNT